MWISKNDLETLSHTPRLVERIHQSSSGILVIQEPKARNCPYCKVQLEAWLIQGSESVEIDTCPQCQGIWLDQGELQRIAVMQNQGKFQKTRKQNQDKHHHHPVADGLADVAFFAPDLTVLTVDSAVDIAGGLTEVATEALPASAELISSSTEVVASSAAAVLDAAGGMAEAAGGIGDVFSGIADLFGGLFS